MSDRSSPVLHPQTGKPADSSDPFFLQVTHELSDKDFSGACCRTQVAVPRVA